MHRAAARRLALAIATFVLAGCGSEPLSAVQLPTPAAGTSSFAANGYVEYIAGNLPVIFTAPHGGTISAADIPVRVAGDSCGPAVTTVRDTNTEELVREIRDAFFARTGKYPHVVINRLRRDRLDPNRPVGEAACGDAEAVAAWEAYHAFIEKARARVITDFGRGWYTDLHGHGHSIQQLELGYTLSGATLRQSDAELDADVASERASSIRTFSGDSPLGFAALLSGPTALGTLFAEAGFAAVPSAQRRAPAAGEPYFSGGYSTERHGCADGGPICGVQIEANFTGVRDTGPNRARFAATIVDVYAKYLAQFGIRVTTPGEG